MGSRSVQSAAGWTRLFNISKTKFRDHLPIIIVLVGFLALGIALIPAYRYQINPDATSYISIADKYSHGDFRNAVNSYWGPLLSWLIVPAFWFDVSPIAAIKLLQILVALSLVSLVYMILKSFFGKIFALWGAIIAGIITMDLALAGPMSPDLIVCALTLLLLLLISRKPEPSKINILVGITGTLLYFTKSAGFFLFLGGWVLWVLSDWFFSQKHRPKFSTVLKNRVTSLVVFFILILPFCLAISLKFGQPTIGTSGSYNFAVVGPHSGGHPVMNHLIPPPNDSAISAWEDVSKEPVNSWNPLSSRVDQKAFFKNIRLNLYIMNQILLQFIWPMLIIALIYVLIPGLMPTNRFKFLLLSFSLLTLLLYIPIFMEIRYIFFVIIACVIGFVGFLSAATSAHGLRRASPLLLFGVAVSLGVVSVPIQNLTDSKYINRDVFEQSQALKPLVAKGEHLASDDFGSIYACYYIQAKCYGVVNISGGRAPTELNKYKIKSLLLAPASAKKLTGQGVKLGLIKAMGYQGRNLYRVYN